MKELLATPGVGLTSQYVEQIGQVAKRYYAGGRTIDAAGLQQTFQSMLADAKQMQGRYSGQIAEQARSLDLGKLLSVVKS